MSHETIGVLREVDASAKIRDVIRRHGISEQTYHRWKGKCGGMDVSEARRLKALEDENRRPKHLVADLTLDNQALKALNAKMVTPVVRRAAVSLLVTRVLVLKARGSERIEREGGPSCRGRAAAG